MSFRHLSILLAVAATLSARPSSAQDPAVDAALEADQVNQEHCANLYTAQVDQAASATVAVAESWQQVDAVYAETGAVYLLYWRGALAQCLGREEAALADLTSFVESQANSTMFASLVQNAKTRLRRLGRGVSVGQGGAAAFLRLGPALELEASWAAGSGVHSIACTDAVNAALENATCLGGGAGRPDYAPALALASTQLAVDGFFSRGFGVGGRLFINLAAPSNLPTSRSPGPTLQVHVGPQMRLLNSVASGGRAGWFRAEARFATSFTRMSPMAGSAKYGWGRLGGYLDPGSWDLRHVGVAARVEGSVEIGLGFILFMSGHYAWYAPMAGSHATHAVGPSAVELAHEDPPPATRSEEVEILPELLSTSQMTAGLRVGLLLPTKVTSVAVGPFIGVDFLRATMTFPNDENDCWQVGSDDACEGAGTVTVAEDYSGDLTYRKVFSSARHDLYVTVGIDGRFGVQAKQ